MSLEGTVCIVTGSARGIGRAINMRLGTEGASVVYADLNLEQAEQAAAEARSKGVKAIAVGTDVTKREQVRSLIARTVSEFGKLDVMFNNAGINRIQHFLEVTEDNWERILRVNGLGVLLGMQESAKQMIAQGSGGKIINAASIAGRQGFPDIAPYCASKFSVIALTQAGARALAEHKITVNAYAPGVVDTPLWEQLDQEYIDLGDTTEPGEAMRNFSADILLGRVAQPDDIAKLAVFLASPESDYITGQTINVEGGMILS